MSRMTATSMESFVRKALGGIPTESFSQAEVLRWINLAMIRVYSRRYMPILQKETTVTTVASTAEYELDVDDMLFIVQLVDTTNNFVLEEMDLREYNMYTQGTTTTTRKPERWFISGVGSNNRRQVTIYPTPAGAYTIKVYYQRRPDDLVLNPTATSTIGYETFDVDILNEAIAIGYEAHGDFERAAATRQLSGMASTADNTVREHSETAFSLGNNIGYESRRR